MGKHVITIESVGSHTHPKYGGTVKERAERAPGSAEAHGRAPVKALRESGHRVEKATITHWPGEEEHTESLLDEE